MPNGSKIRTAELHPETDGCVEHYSVPSHLEDTVTGTAFRLTTVVGTATCVSVQRPHFKYFKVLAADSLTDVSFVPGHVDGIRYISLPSH